VGLARVVRWIEANRSARVSVSLPRNLPINQAEDAGEDDLEAAADQPVFRVTVQQQKQAKMESKHPDGIVYDFSHPPLAQEEKFRARVVGLEHIRSRWNLTPKTGGRSGPARSSSNGGSARGRNASPSGQIRASASPGWSWRR
jgi:hypothetical protein